MKKIVALLCISVLLSCSANDDDTIIENSTNIVEEVVAETTMNVMGNFVSGAHPTSGKASVNDKKTTLSLTNFKTDNGPKLLLYLSTDANSTEFVNLGNLKGVEGDFTYAIPENTNLSKYKIVNVWCVDFSVSFGTAELK